MLNLIKGVPGRNNEQKKLLYSDFTNSSSISSLFLRSKD